MTRASMDVSDPRSLHNRSRRHWPGAVVVGIVVVALAAPCWAGTVSGLGASTEVAERALREHPLHTLDGKTLMLGDMRGDVVVVNFWASWCSPCRRELPRLETLQEGLAGSGSRMVAVSLDQNPEDTRRFCRSKHVTLTVAQDGPNGLAHELDLKRVPLTLVLDRNGHIIFTTSRSDAEGLAALATEVFRSSAEPLPRADAIDAGEGSGR